MHWIVLFYIYSSAVGQKNDRWLFTCQYLSRSCELLAKRDILLWLKNIYPADPLIGNLMRQMENLQFKNLCYPWKDYDQKWEGLIVIESILCKVILLYRIL